MRLCLFAAAFVLAAGSANATVVSWADWQSSIASTVSGTIVAGAKTVDVTFDAGSAGFDFVRINGAGTNYWTQGIPAPYTSGSVSNAPPDSDIIALDKGGLKTITFSQPVTDPYIALVSWNGNAATFSEPFVEVSEGCGYWGCGTFSLGAGNSFVGNGEVHGILEFQGTFASVTFTDSTEDWHGLTIGIGGVAPVDEPAGLGVFALALTGLGVLRRARFRQHIGDT